MKTNQHLVQKALVLVLLVCVGIATYIFSQTPKQDVLTSQKKQELQRLVVSFSEKQKTEAKKKLGDFEEAQVHSYISLLSEENEKNKEALVTKIREKYKVDASTSVEILNAMNKEIETAVQEANQSTDKKIAKQTKSIHAEILTTESKTLGSIQKFESKMTQALEQGDPLTAIALYNQMAQAGGGQVMTPDKNMDPTMIADSLQKELTKQTEGLVLKDFLPSPQAEAAVNFATQGLKEIERWQNTQSLQQPGKIVEFPTE